MDVEETRLEGLKILTPRVFADPRGYFFESYNSQAFNDAVGEPVSFAQDNESYSQKNVLRGLHYQVENPQGKLVRAVVGEIFDVAVDIRRSSPTFGQWVGVTLSAENKRQLWVPVGFAHGFLVTSETAIVAYKATDFYNADGERAISWDDAEIGIDWPLEGTPEVSEKDKQAVPLADADVFA